MVLKNRAVFCLICLVIIVFTRTAGAQDWYLSPRIEATGEYNSNILFTSDNKVSDYFTHLRPAFDLARDTEQTQLHFNTAMNAEMHVLHPDLDTVENDSQVVLMHQWSPRLSNTFSGTFAHDETLNQELLAAGLVTRRVERYSFGSGLTSDYALSETKKLSVGVNMADTIYPGGEYPDLQVLAGRINPSWQINPYNTVGMLADYSVADYKSVGSTPGLTNRTLATSLTWRHYLSETTFFDASGGLNTAWVENETLGFGRQSTSENIIGSFSLSKTWTDRFSTTFAAGRDQYNTVNAQSSEHAFIRANAGYKFSELTVFGIDLGYDSNVQDGGGTNSDSFRIAPTLTRRISERLSLTFGTAYQYVAEDRNAARDQMRVWVSLVYDWPRALANH